MLPRLMERCRGDIVCSCRPERSSGCPLNSLGWVEVEAVGKVGEDGRDDRSTRTLSIKAGGAVGDGESQGLFSASGCRQRRGRLLRCRLD